MATTKTLFKTRSWLNTDKSMRAHVIGCVDVTISKNGGSIDAYFDIGDCHRNISLDLNCYNYNGRNQKELDKDFKNNLEKVRKLIKALQGVEEAMVEAKELLDANNPG